MLESFLFVDNCFDCLGSLQAQVNITTFEIVNIPIFMDLKKFCMVAGSLYFSVGKFTSQDLYCPKLFQALRQLSRMLFSVPSKWRSLNLCEYQE